MSKVIKSKVRIYDGYDKLLKEKEMKGECWQKMPSILKTLKKEDKGAYMIVIETYDDHDERTAKIYLTLGHLREDVENDLW